MAQRGARQQSPNAIPHDSNGHSSREAINPDDFRAPLPETAPWAGDETIDYTQLQAPSFLLKPQAPKVNFKKVAARHVHNQEFVRRYECQESQIPYGVIRDKTNREVTYIVPQSLYEPLSDFIVYAHIELLINNEGDLFFMTVPFSTYQGHTFEYWVSMQEAMVEATTAWVKVLSNRNANRYYTRPPEVPIPDPEWPEIKWGELFSAAYKGRVLHPGHPFMRRLVGGK
jgi:hypothetical protein